MHIKEKLVSFFDKALSYLNISSVCEGISATKEAQIDILVALMPASIFGCVLFGWYAMLLLFLCVGFALLTDFLWNLLFTKRLAPPRIYSAITGLIFGMCLPARAPFWVAILGSVLAVVISKWSNKYLVLTNSAVISKAILALVFPMAFSAFAEPFTNAATAETPLTFLHSGSAYVPSAKYLFFGLQSGDIAETSVFLLLVGGIYLVIRKIISPVIPLCFTLTLAVLSLIFGDDLSVALMGGGLFIGALFLSNAFTNAPVKNYKKIIFGLLCGVLTFLIRRFFAPADGVIYAIIIANLIVLLADKNTISKIIYFIKNFDFGKIKAKLLKHNNSTV